ELALCYRSTRPNRYASLRKVCVQVIEVDPIDGVCYNHPLTKARGCRCRWGWRRWNTHTFGNNSTVIRSIDRGSAIIVRQAEVDCSAISGVALSAVMRELALPKLRYS